MQIFIIAHEQMGDLNRNRQSNVTNINKKKNTQPPPPAVLLDAQVSSAEGTGTAVCPVQPESSPSTGRETDSAPCLAP